MAGDSRGPPALERLGPRSSLLHLVQHLPYSRCLINASHTGSSQSGGQPQLRRGPVNLVLQGAVRSGPRRVWNLLGQRFFRLLCDSRPTNTGPHAGRSHVQALVFLRFCCGVAVLCAETPPPMPQSWSPGWAWGQLPPRPSGRQVALPAARGQQGPGTIWWWPKQGQEQGVGPSGGPCLQAAGAWPPSAHMTPWVHLGAQGHCGQELTRGHLSGQGTLLLPLALGLSVPRRWHVQAARWLGTHLRGGGWLRGGRRQVKA